MIEKMKQIGIDIFENEKQNGNMKSEYFLMTPEEYYNSDLINPNRRIPFIGNLGAKIVQLPGGSYSNGKIVVLLQEKGSEAQTLWKFIKICYHEIQHNKQERFDPMSYSGFLMDIERFIREKAPEDYEKEHDKYSFEIGANLFSIEKAAEYMKKHFPKEYEEIKNLIIAEFEQYKFDYMTYDSATTFDRMYGLYMRESEKHPSDKKVNIDEISPVLNIFLNQNGSFKQLSEIINNEEFQKIDNRTKFTILTSKSFLKVLDITNLTEEEKLIMDTAVEYMRDVYLNQEKWLEKETEIKDKRIKAEKNILLRLKTIVSYIEMKHKHQTNQYRDDQRDKEHKENIIKYGGRTRTLQKTSGYITISMFYIIGIITSLSTIVYLLITK